MILVFEAFLASGVIYAGMKAYRKRRRKDQRLWLTENANTTIEAPPEKEVSFTEMQQAINRDFTISSISLGMSIAGGLVAPPLGVASIPLTIYGAVPIFEDAFEAAFNVGRAKLSIASSVVTIGALMVNYNLLASVIQWGHHLNQKMLLEVDHSYRQFLTQLYGPKSRLLWLVIDNVEVQVPFKQMKLGDIVAVSAEEVIPIDGTIIDGEALIDTYVLNGNARPQEKSVGDRVYTATTVVSGKIYIKIEKL